MSVVQEIVIKLKGLKEGLHIELEHILLFRNRSSV